jgi:hypothetical protein
LGLGRFSVSWSYIVSSTPWTGDQLFSRPLPTHRTTETQNKRTKYKHQCFEWDSNPRSQRLKAAYAVARSLYSTGIFLGKQKVRHLLSFRSCKLLCGLHFTSRSLKVNNIALVQALQTQREVRPWEGCQWLSPVCYANSPFLHSSLRIITQIDFSPHH